MNSSILDRMNYFSKKFNKIHFSLDLLERISGVIKRLFELKQSDKVKKRKEKFP